MMTKNLKIEMLALKVNNRFLVTALSLKFAICDLKIFVENSAAAVVTRYYTSFAAGGILAAEKLGYSRKQNKL